MKRIIQILILVLITMSVFAEEKKDTIVAKTKHKVHVSISQINELNYSNDTKITFKDTKWEHANYSYSGGLTISFILNKYFSIGSGLVYDQFSISYYTEFPFGSKPRYERNKFFFIGMPIIPDLFYNWKNVSFHIIPELRIDIFSGVNVGSMRFNNNILILACPKFEISYTIFDSFSLFINFGIKYSLAQMKNTHYNSTWFGDRLAIYSLSGGGGLGLNFKL